MNFLRFIGVMKTVGNRQDVIGRDEFGNIIIDSCFTPDTQKWETGVKKGDDSWIIVEMYDTREKAIAGHKKWRLKLKKNPKLKLKNCDWMKGGY